jgi:hypothetical protein
MILGETEQDSFRMLHALICRTDIVRVFLCGCEIWCYVKKRTQIVGL